MTNRKRRHLIIVGDRSGSMWMCRVATQEGINGFFAAQALEGHLTTASLYEFDDLHDVVFEHLPLDQVPAYTLVPRNRTALLDAVAYAVNREGAWLASLPEEERPDIVIVVIATDGQENASTEFTLPEVRAMIKHQQEKYAWEFIFLGANMDAVQVGTSYGIPQYNTMSYDTARTGQTYTATSAAVTRMSSGLGSGFTDDERQAASGDVAAP